MGTKYIFKNIGPIKKAEMELGDLTIIAGRNNTGKTYLAYSLYGLLKHMEDFARKISVFANYPISEFERDLFKSESNEALFRCGANNDSGPSIWVDFFYESVNKHMMDIASMETHPYISSISDVFAATYEQFEGAEIDFDFRWEPEPNQQISGTEIGEEKIRYMELGSGKKIFRVAIVNNEGFNTSDMSYERDIIAVRCLLLLFIKKAFPSVVIQSSERQGISLFYKELDFARNRIVEKFQRAVAKEAREEDLLDLAKSSSRYAQPVRDDIDFTRDLEYIQKQKGQLADHKLFGDIEDMMGGYYRYANNGILFISTRKGKNGFTIPLYTASSSARGLSDLYFYLKHVAQKGQLLIIDEPESHLDTADQILMARLLARCVNAGIKVLITTHSDYIIKEFNNLIMLSSDFDDKAGFLKRYKGEYTKNDYLNIESVKGYTCEKGRLVKCKVNKYGINMPVFDNTINHINEISDTLALQLEE